MAFKVRAGTNFAAGLYQTTSDQYDYANQGWAAWTGGAGYVARTSGIAHTVRFKITTPSTGTSLDRLDVYTDIYLEAGTAIAPLAAIIKVADAGTNTFVRPYDPSKAISTTLSSAGVSVGDLKGSPPSGQHTGVRHFKASFTKDANGKALAFGTQYYIYFFPGGTANHSWGIMAYNSLTFEMQIDAAITTYTSATAPTSVSVTSTKVVSSRIVPGNSVTVSWSGHKAGTANPIKSFTIQYKPDNSSTWTNWATGVGASSTSYTAKLPSNTRGRGYSFRVTTVATHNTITSTANSGIIYNNRIPGNPTGSVTGQGTTVKNGTSSVTHTMVAGADSDGHTRTLYRSSSASGAKSLVSTNTLSLSVGSNNFYFWTWDGLEYSSSVLKTVVRNSAPTITFNSISVRDSLVDDNYTPTTAYPFSHLVRVAATANKAKGTFYYYSRKASTTGGLSSATVVATGSRTVASTSAISHDIDIPSYRTGLFSNYIEIGVKYSDGIDETSVVWQRTNQTIKGFYLGGPVTLSGAYSTIGSNANVSNTNPNHFYRSLRISHSRNTAISSKEIIFSTTSGGTRTAATGTASSSNTHMALNNLSGPLGAGTQYYFRVRAKYKNGDVVESTNSLTKTQVPVFTFQNLDRSASVSKVVESSSSQTVSFTDTSGGSFLQNFSIKDISAFSISLHRGTNNREVGIGFTSGHDFFTAQLPDSTFYPFDLDGTGPSHNPFNLPFNSTHQAYFRVAVQNGFGTWVTANTPNFTLSLVYAPVLTGTTEVQLSRSSGSWEILSDSAKIFEGEKLRFNFPRAKSYNGTPLQYEILQKEGSGSYVPIFSTTLPGQGSSPTPAENQGELTIPVVPASQKYWYQVRVVDNIGATSTLSFPVSVQRAQKIPALLAMGELIPDSSTDLHQVRFSVTSLGGSYDYIDLIEGGSFKSLSLYLEASTSSDFTQNYEERLINNWTASLSDAVGEKTIAIESILDLTPYVIGYMRIRLEAFPDVPTGSTLAKKQTSYSPTFIYYSEQPTLSWRKNWVGVNTSSEGVDEVFTISETSTKTLLVLKGADSTITIDLRAGTIDGIIIDGGSW